PGVVHILQIWHDLQFQGPWRQKGLIFESGVCGKVFIDPGYFCGEAFHFYDLTEGIDVAEDGCGGGFGKTDRGRVFLCPQVSPQHFQVEHGGRLGLDIEAGPGNGFIVIKENGVGPVEDGYGFEVVREILAERLGEWGGQAIPGLYGAVQVDVLHDLDHAVEV